MAADATGPDPKAPDPKALWREQDREAAPVTLEQIHALVRRYGRKDRLRIAALALTMLGAGTVGVLTRMRDPVMSLLFVGGELATCAFAYRMIFPARDPSEPAGEYLRRRLLLRLQHLQGRWVLAVLPLAPCILWVGWMMVQRSQLPLGRRLAPFVVIAVAIAWIVVRTRQRSRKVKADLEELDGLLRG